VSGPRSTLARIGLVALAALLALLPAAAPATAAPAVPAVPAVTAKEAVLVDAASGAVLWGRLPHRAALVASTTKMLTALVAEASYRPGQRLKVPEAAELVDGSRIGLQTGMVLTREQLLVALLAVSANDAAETLAAGYPGGRAGFLVAMRTEAARLGCTDSTWTDPTGLDAPGHRASPADLALIGRALLARPVLARIVGSPRVTFRWPGGRQVVLANHNKLVSQGKDPGAIGIKTGFTTKAGHTLVAAERKGGRTLIAVVLGATDSYADTRSMFAFGFRAPVPAGAERLGPREDQAREIRPAPAGTGRGGSGLVVVRAASRLPHSPPVAIGAALATAALLTVTVRTVRARRRYRPLH
jgi:D-alanyl-D-alanine carboxypeptidase (penicillin-binding protein 5/6)